MHGTVSNAAATAVSTPDPAIPARRWLGWAAVATLAIYAFLVALNRKVIAEVTLRDPDDQLRLQQVRDLLGGQGWFDLHQYRIDAANGGVLMHWSRLVDAPIAAVILAFRPFLGTSGAELAALLLVPALTLFAIVAVVSWMAGRMLPTKGARGFALLAMGFAAPVLIQTQPLRIDHHAWQIALAAAAMASFVDCNQRRGGWIAGTALATWMAISFEGLPMSAWFVVATALMALRDSAFRPRLVGTVQALALVSAGLYLATRGFADLAEHCDAISPVHLAIFAWGALAVTAATKFLPTTRLWLLGGLAVAGAGALAIVAGVAPQCTSGSFNMLDPVVKDFWYDRVLEGRPVYELPFALAMQYVLPPLLGLIGAAMLARRTAGHARSFWIAYVLVMAGALAVSIMVSRAGSIPAVLAALPLGWLFSRWIAGMRRPDGPLLRVGELALIAFMIFGTLLPIVPATALGQLVPVFDKPVDNHGDLTLACSAEKAKAALDALPAGDILAPLDFGPDILLATERGVLASGHHRGATAMRAEIDAFTGTPERARAIMAAKKLRFVMVCPNVQEMDVYRRKAPKGFAAQLIAGQIPAWLREIKLPRESQLKMWQVVE
jgi:hypothetical protein